MQIFNVDVMSRSRVKLKLSVCVCIQAYIIKDWRDKLLEICTYDLYYIVVVICLIFLIDNQCGAFQKMENVACQNM
jgi:hypothetical protein